MAASIVAITSGKGGVGKTAVTANLAIALGRLGRRVTVLDADMGLANLDVALGLVPKKTLEHFFHGSIDLGEIVIEGPAGIRLIPGGSGIPELTALATGELLRFVDALARVREECDLLLIDTAAGIGDQVSRMVSLADRVLLVTWPDPTALVDAYAALKVSRRRRPDQNVGLVVNGVENEAEASRVHARLTAAATRFLGQGVDLDGFIARDEALQSATRRQLSVVISNPLSPSSRCFERLALTLTAQLHGQAVGCVGERCASASRAEETMH
jgi:flagellar biosynthesis protein FlhG